MTNETLHTLETRRSCRAYKPEQITKEELEAVLRAGTFAPSAMNRQSAKIVVVQDAETRAQLTRMNAAVMGNCRHRAGQLLDQPRKGRVRDRRGQGPAEKVGH